MLGHFKKIYGGQPEMAVPAFYFVGSIMENSEPLPGSENTLISVSYTHLDVYKRQELAKKNDEQLTIFRRRNIGFIFQNYNLCLLYTSMKNGSVIQKQNLCIAQELHLFTVSRF